MKLFILAFVLLLMTLVTFILLASAGVAEAKTALDSRRRNDR